MATTAGHNKAVSEFAEKRERRVREGFARLQQDERWEMAEKFGFPDGMPLTADEIRLNVRRFREFGTSRLQALASLSGPSDIMQRRIGALNADEIGVIFEQEWPEYRK